MAAFPRDALLINVQILFSIHVFAKKNIQVFFEGCDGPEGISLFVLFDFIRCILRIVYIMPCPHHNNHFEPMTIVDMMIEVTVHITQH